METLKGHCLKSSLMNNFSPQLIECNAIYKGLANRLEGEPGIKEILDNEIKIVDISYFSCAFPSEYL